MKKKLLFLFLLLVSMGKILLSQTFTRSELPTSLNTPWEIIYGPDNYLWLTESGGRISRVNPEDGSKEVVYTAPDYFGGSALENHPYCFHPPIGSGTLGMALHPDFLNPDSAFVYFLYSYNAGSDANPETRFKIRRITWNHALNTAGNPLDIVTDLPSSYDHLGGRLLIVEQEETYYLFVSIGDNGLSETNSPDCYPDQTLNPNNQAQNPATKNGKIHRFNLDGSIPADNPIAGNSFYTRGHRNPQGLIFNPAMNLLYEVEHGDRTDDEINILHKGMNYGWKNVRGYHHDQNFESESDYIMNYQPNPQIMGDSLVEAFYAWCAVPLSTSANNLEWCTVAPSDGIYYGSTTIPQWYNSLLVVTLKNGADTDMELYQFKLSYDGSLAASSAENPNPRRFFGEDQALNGRLRDVCISPDGKKIFLINNGGAPADKITVYTVDPASIAPFDDTNSDCFWLYPNPSQDLVSLVAPDSLSGDFFVDLTDANGQSVAFQKMSNTVFDLSALESGFYVFTISHPNGVCVLRFVKD